MKGNFLQKERKDSWAQMRVRLLVWAQRNHSSPSIAVSSSSSLRWRFRADGVEDDTMKEQSVWRETRMSSLSNSWSWTGSPSISIPLRSSKVKTASSFTFLTRSCRKRRNRVEVEAHNQEKVGKRKQANSQSTERLSVASHSCWNCSGTWMVPGTKLFRRKTESIKRPAARKEVCHVWRSHRSTK